MFIIRRLVYSGSVPCTGDEQYNFTSSKSVLEETSRIVDAVNMVAFAVHELRVGNPYTHFYYAFFRTFLLSTFVLLYFQDNNNVQNSAAFFETITGKQLYDKIIEMKNNGLGK